MLPASATGVPPFVPEIENAYGPNKLWFEILITTGALPGSPVLSFDVAVTDTDPLGGGNNGAVYTPVCEMLPQSLSLVADQVTFQVTFAVAPFTVAAKVCCAPAERVAEEGLINTGAEGAVLVGVNVTFAVPLTVVSAWEMALTVTVDAAAMVAGDVYRPVVEIRPTEEFPPSTPFTCQFTAVFVAFATVAVNCAL
jgi:hypothetical protein